MAKFSTGFLTGLVLGGLYGLLTTKKTGPQRLESVSNHLTDLAAAGADFTQSLGAVKAASHRLSTELQTTAKSAAEDLNKTMDSFQFQTEPRIKQINAEIEDLTDTLSEVQPKKSASDL